MSGILDRAEKLAARSCSAGSRRQFQSDRDEEKLDRTGCRVLAFGIRRAIAGPFNPAIIPAMYFSRLVTGVKRWFGA